MATRFTKIEFSWFSAGSSPSSSWAVPICCATALIRYSYDNAWPAATSASHSLTIPRRGYLPVLMRGSPLPARLRGSVPNWRPVFIGSAKSKRSGQWTCTSSLTRSSSSRRQRSPSVPLDIHTNVRVLSCTALQMAATLMSFVQVGSQQEHVCVQIGNLLLNWLAYPGLPTHLFFLFRSQPARPAPILSNETIVRGVGMSVTPLRWH